MNEPATALPALPAATTGSRRATLRRLGAYLRPQRAALVASVAAFTFGCGAALLIPFFIWELGARPVMQLTTNNLLSLLDPGWTAAMST